MAKTGTSGRVVLGRVVGAHGVRGMLRVGVSGNGPASLLEAPSVELSFEDRDPTPPVRSFAVVSASAGRPGEVRLGLEGVADRDAAEALRGARVLGDAAHLPALEPGEHYWFELIGCEVETTSGSPLGVVREIWETGAHDVLVVADPAGGDHLIPAVDAFVKEIDRAARRIRIEPVPGLPAGGGAR
jgi:16S rRNA processing protein RimM